MPGNSLRSSKKKQRLAHRRLDVAQMYLAGVPQLEIAERLGISQPTVSSDLAYMRAEWLKSSLRDFDQAKANELIKIDAHELLCHEAFKKSQTTVHAIKLPRKLPDDWKLTFDNLFVAVPSAGDYRFLQGAQWCIEQRCKILGLYAPTRNEHTGKDGGAIQTESKVQHDLSRLTLEELIALRSMVEKTHVDLAVAA